MATTYNDFLPDLGQLQSGDVILYGNKLNSQNQNIQSLFGQGAASPYRANGLDTIGLTVTKPYVKPTTTYTAEGAPVYRVTDNFGYDLPSNNAVSDREALLRTQEDALRQDYLSQTGDISNQYNSLRQTTLDAGNRNMGVLNRILGRAGGFTTTAGGTALVAKQGELDNQINQLNLAQQQALNKARVAYTKGNSDLLAQANSDIVAIKDKIAAAQAESAKNLLEMEKQSQGAYEFEQNYALKQQEQALAEAKFEFEKANPNIKTDIATMTINGKPHNVLINMQTGQPIKDLGESVTTEKPITQQVGNTLLQYNTATGQWEQIFSAPTSIKSNIVKINGTDYQVDENGNLSTPQVPASEVSEMKTNALNSAQELLNKFNTGKGTAAVGMSRMFGTQYIPGSDPKNFEIQFNNLKSLLSLDNVKYLKGQGQVSDAERKLLSEASAKLDLSQSEGEFKKALQDIIKALSGSTTKGGKTKEQLQAEFPNATPAEIDALFKEESSFNKVGGDTNQAVSKALNISDGTKAGQCGRFVNQYTGLGLGDTYQSKLAKMDKSITYPEPGMVFVMPYKNTGHTGFIKNVNNDGTVTVKDSNYSLDGKVKTHKLAINLITGLTRV